MFNLCFTLGDGSNASKSLKFGIIEKIIQFSVQKSINYEKQKNEGLNQPPIYVPEATLVPLVVDGLDRPPSSQALVSNSPEH